MKKLTLFLLVGILAIGGSMSAAADEGFAGTWKLDQAQSSMGEMYSEVVPDITLVLSMDGAKLTLRRVVTVMGTERSSQIVLTTDGKECSNDGESLKGLKSICRLDGGKMIISGEREAVRMMVMGEGEPQTDYLRYKIDEEYSLSSDGRVLTVVQKMAMPDGDVAMTLVFNRA